MTQAIVGGIGIVGCVALAFAMRAAYLSQVADAKALASEMIARAGDIRERNRLTVENAQLTSDLAAARRLAEVAQLAAAAATTVEIAHAEKVARTGTASDMLAEARRLQALSGSADVPEPAAASDATASGSGSMPARG